MNIADLLIEALGGGSAQDLFNGKLSLLMGDVDVADPVLQSHLTESAVTFAALCLARNMMWHVKDHDDISCAQDGIQVNTIAFARVAIGRCKEIAQEEGIPDPFMASDVNADLVKEMLRESDS